MEVRTSAKFDKSLRKYVKNNRKRAKQSQETLIKLKHIPIPNSLNLEKLANFEIWSIRINKCDWIFLQFIANDIILLRDLGPHDKYRKLKMFT